MWFYAKDGEQQGPVEAEVIRAQLAAGELNDATLVWKEGMDQWTPLGKVQELQAVASAPTVEAPSADASMLGGETPAPQTSQAAANPYQSPTQTPYQAPQLQAPAPQSGMAIASMVLGILSFFTCGFLGLVAVPLGHIARAKIRNSSVPISGGGMALAGLITGYIGVVIFLLYIGLFIFGAMNDLS